MRFISWLDNLKSGPVRTRAARRRSGVPRKRAAAGKLCLEPLEDRTVPSFASAVNYSVGLTPNWIAKGDFNGDGHLDLVTANIGANTVSVLLGNGDGTFQAAQSYVADTGVTWVAVGDFNGDGKLDIVTANATAGDLSVLLGNGDGTFQAAKNFTLPGQFPPGYLGSTPLPQAPLSVVVGDVNGDGKLDLVVTGNTSYTSPGYCGYYSCYPGITTNSGYANVMLGHGDGTFSTGNSYLLSGGYPKSAALADFNGDAKLDLVTVNNDNNTFSLLLGNGDGSFQAPTNTATGPGPYAPAVGDFNGDGKLDLAVANSGSNTVGVFLGNGDGTFQAPVNSATGASPITSAVGDFNGDGKLDLAIANSGSNNVSVLLGNGDGTFKPILNYAADSVPQSLAVGDFNGDGLPDLAVSNQGSSDVSVLLNQNDWSGPTFLQLSGFPATTTAGDAHGFTVTVEDSFGNVATGYLGTVHFTSSDVQAGLPADYTFTAADAGIHQFSATLKTAGAQSITAADTATANLTGTESGITVNPAAASTLTVAGFPSSTTAGVAGNFTVTAKDAFGNTATGYTGTVSFSSSDGQAVLPGNYTFLGSDAGMHTFSATLKTAGTQSLTATDTMTSSITGSEGGIVVNAAAASQLMLAAPASVTSGVRFTITVTALDPYNNIATSYRGTVHFTSTDSRARLPRNYTFTATDAGVHSFINGVILRTVGNDSVTATDTVTNTIKGTTTIAVVRGKGPAATPLASIVLPSAASATPLPAAWMTTPGPAPRAAPALPPPTTLPGVGATLDRAARDSVFAAAGDTRGPAVSYPSSHVPAPAGDWWAGLMENPRLV